MPMPMFPPPQQFEDEQPLPSGMPMLPPQADIAAQAPPPSDIGITAPEQVADADYPPLPVGAPPGDPMGGMSDPRDDTADMLARVVAAVGKRYSQGGGM